MSKISKANQEVIKNNILRILFDESPRAISATKISKNEARDKQFILKILRELEKSKIVRNSTKKFVKKSYWVMTNEAYKKYKELL